MTEEIPTNAWPLTDQAGERMVPDETRVRIVRSLLERERLDAVVCRLPANVLMLTGYVSALGRAFAIFPRAGSPALLVPRDELAEAQRSWVLDIQTYDVSPLARTAALAESKLAQIAFRLALEGKRIGFEGSVDLLPPTATPTSGVGFETLETYRRVFSAGGLVDATALLAEAAAVKTLREIDQIRRACEIAAFAFQRARETIRPDTTEGEVAGAIADAILGRGFGYHGVARVFPFPRVVSGSRTLGICRPNVDTSERVIARGDPVVVTLVLSADGFVVEAARTFFVGRPTPVQEAIYNVCLAAQRAALAAIRDGVRATEVVAIVQRTFADHGLGEACFPVFGHGVGFQAVLADCRPRLVAGSPDVLMAGMTHTLDLTVIAPDAGGIRLADVVLVQPLGAEIISRIERSLEWVSG